MLSLCRGFPQRLTHERTDGRLNSENTNGKETWQDENQPLREVTRDKTGISISKISVAQASTAPHRALIIKGGIAKKEPDRTSWHPQLEKISVPRKLLDMHHGKYSVCIAGSGTVPLWFFPAASTCHARTTPDWSVLLFGEGNKPTLPPPFLFHSRSRGCRRHSSGRGCPSRGRVTRYVFWRHPVRIRPKTVPLRFLMSLCSYKYSTVTLIITSSS